jgi:drug/metabolite transporter (DMT)-like permease
LGGIALLTGAVGGAGAARADPLGVALGLATGGFYASYLFVVRRARRAEGRLGPFALMAWISLASAVASGLLAQVDGTRAWPVRWETWGALLGLACVGQGLGWVTIATCLPRVPMSRAGLLLLLQPTFAAVWAAAFFGRHLSPLALAGAVLALLGVYGGSVPGYGPPASDRDPDAA